MRKQLIIWVDYDKPVHIEGVVQRAINVYPVCDESGNVEISYAGGKEVTRLEAAALEFLGALVEEMETIAHREACG